MDEEKSCLSAFCPMWFLGTCSDDPLPPLDLENKVYVIAYHECTGDSVLHISGQPLPVTSCGGPEPCRTLEHNFREAEQKSNGSTAFLKVGGEPLQLISLGTPEIIFANPLLKKGEYESFSFKDMIPPPPLIAGITLPYSTAEVHPLFNFLLFF